MKCKPLNERRVTKDDRKNYNLPARIRRLATKFKEMRKRSLETSLRSAAVQEVTCCPIPISCRACLLPTPALCNLTQAREWAGDLWLTKKELKAIVTPLDKLAGPLIPSSYTAGDRTWFTYIADGMRKARGDPFRFGMQENGPLSGPAPPRPLVEDNDDAHTDSDFSSDDPDLDTLSGEDNQARAHARAGTVDLSLESDETPTGEAANEAADEAADESHESADEAAADEAADEATPTSTAQSTPFSPTTTEGAKVVMELVDFLDDLNDERRMQLSTSDSSYVCWPRPETTVPDQKKKEDDQKKEAVQAPAPAPPAAQAAAQPSQENKPVQSLASSARPHGSGSGVPTLFRNGGVVTPGARSITLMSRTQPAAKLPSPAMLDELHNTTSKMEKMAFKAQKDEQKAAAAEAKAAAAEAKAAQKAKDAEAKAAQKAKDAEAKANQKAAAVAAKAAAAAEQKAAAEAKVAAAAAAKAEAAAELARQKAAMKAQQAQAKGNAKGNAHQALAQQVPAPPAQQAPAPLAQQAPAQQAPAPPAQQAPAPLAQQAPEAPAQQAPAPPAQQAPAPLAQQAPEAPAQQAPAPPALPAPAPQPAQQAPASATRLLCSGPYGLLLGQCEKCFHPVYENECALPLCFLSPCLCFLSLLSPCLAVSPKATQRMFQAATGASISTPATRP